MKVKGFLLIVILFLAACAPDSPGGSGRPVPQKAVSPEQRARAELLSEFYCEWKRELAKVQWKDRDEKTLRLAEAFVLGSISNKYLLYLEIESLPLILEVFRVLPDGYPENTQLLKLALATLKH